jgi:hypothetical protein
MQPDPIRAAHKLRPFKPFTIVTASGERHQVSHPEVMIQSPGGNTIVIMPKGDEFVMIDVASITEIADEFGRKPKKSTE